MGVRYDAVQTPWPRRHDWRPALSAGTTATPRRLPIRTPFHYCWVMVAALAVFSMVTSAMAGPNIAFFINPMSEEMGMSRFEFGMGQAAKLLLVIVTGAFIGRYIDHHGPGKPVAVIAVFGGLAVAALALIDSAWQFIVLFSFMGLLGMGRVADFYVQVPLSKWFVRKRGRAMSYTFLGIILGISVWSYGSQWLIDAVGWRWAWVVFGVGGGAVLLALTPLLRRQPEDYGLLPDGEPASRPAGSPPRRDEVSWTRGDALRTPTFWLMTIGFGLFMLSTSTMNLYRTPFFVEKGLETRLVATAISSEVGIGVALGLFGGRFLDRLNVRFVVLAGFMGTFATALLSRFTDTPAELFLATNLFAIGASISAIGQGVLWANTFGRAHIGAIRGITSPVTMVFSAVAYPLAGFIRDATGSYSTAFLIAASTVALAAVFIFLARPPRRAAEAPDVPQPAGGAPG